MTGALRVGDVIAEKYRVERLLGEGGMGAVVAARRVDTGDLHAVKIMRSELLGRAGSTARFRREASVGASLRSEHVVRVHDVGGFDEGAPYIAMEHLVGSDLAKLLKARGPFPIREAALYVDQACDAIAAAHAAGVVHRDLKPANLFLAMGPDGRGIIKVLDFGISKLALATEAAVTRTGEAFGSPAYMAPEQIRAFRDVDPRSDVWALGVILYELVTGRRPFPGSGSIEIISRVLERPAVPPSAHRPDLPPALEALLLRCLEKDPARRVQSVRDLRAALAPFLPAAARDPGPASPSAPGSAQPPPGAIPGPSATDGGNTSRPIIAASNRPAEAPPVRVAIPPIAVALAVAGVVIAGLLVALVIFQLPARAPAGPDTPGDAAPSLSPSPTSTPADPPATAHPVETMQLPDAPAPPETAAPSALDGAAPPPDRPAEKPRARPVDAPLEDAGSRPVTPRELDRASVMIAFGRAEQIARKCRRPKGLNGAGKVTVTFAPDGTVTSAQVSAPFEGTPLGRCITTAFHVIFVPPFAGPPVVASKSLTFR